MRDGRREKRAREPGRDRQREVDGKEVISETVHYVQLVYTK